MNNLEGWGGPNPDSWYTRQIALQKDPEAYARIRYRAGASGLLRHGTS